MKKSEEKIITKKLDYFLKNKRKIHIVKHNKSFMNGYVKEKISDEVYKIEDEQGREIEIFTFEIFNITNYSYLEGEKCD